MLTRRKLVLGAGACRAGSAPRRHSLRRLRRADPRLHLPQLRVRPLGRQVLVVQRQPLHARHLPPLLDRRLLQALSAASACAPSAAGSQASASAALRRTGRSSASASAALRRTGRSSASASAAPALCGRKASRRTGPEASAASTRSGPAPAAFRRPRPQAAACRRSGAPSPARRRSASASLRRSGRQRPGRSRRSPLTPLRLNRSRTSHRDAGPSPIHGLPTVSIQVPVFGLTNVRWRTIILAMEG